MKIWVKVGKGREFVVGLPVGSTLRALAQLSTVNVSAKVYQAKVDDRLIETKDWGKIVLYDGQHVKFIWI